jgi:hypothetical protein
MSGHDASHSLTIALWAGFSFPLTAFCVEALAYSCLKAGTLASMSEGQEEEEDAVEEKNTVQVNSYK